MNMLIVCFGTYLSISLTYVSIYYALLAIDGKRTPSDQFTSVAQLSAMGLAAPTTRKRLRLRHVSSLFSVLCY